MRREVTGTNADGTPIYGTNLIPTSYATVQARRTAIGSALLALERAGRLRKADEPANAATRDHAAWRAVLWRRVTGSRTALDAAGASASGPRTAKNGRSSTSPVRPTASSASACTRLLGPMSPSTCTPASREPVENTPLTYSTNHTPLSIIFATANHLPALIKIAPQCPQLRVIVSIDTLPRAERSVLSQWAESVGLELLVFDELEAFGKQPDVQCAPGPVGGIPEEHVLDRDRISPSATPVVLPVSPPGSPVLTLL